MKLLVVEDEQRTATYLKKGLSEHGFVVDVAFTGEDGLHLACTGDYDLIILDILLPDRDGWSVLAELRRAQQQMPVLFLTARDTVQNRVKGLEWGADDYLIKPFAFSELLARIRSVLRRGQAKRSEVLRVADLEIDLLRHKATRGGRPLDLTAKEFALLAFLVQHTGEAVSRTLIAEHVWDINFDSDTSVVDMHVSRLRAKLDQAFPNKLLHTIRGIGYVLEARS